MPRHFRYKSQPSDNFGITDHEFSSEVGIRLDKDVHEWLELRRVSLLQNAFLDPVVAQESGLAATSVVERHDVILDESIPLIRKGLEPVTYILNARPTSGVELTFREIKFLFSTFPVSDSFDFVCWRVGRSPAVDSSWPEVIETNGSTSDLVL